MELAGFLYLGALLEAMLACLGAMLGHLGAILSSLGLEIENDPQNDLWAQLEPTDFGDHFVVILGAFWGHFLVIFTSVWEPFWHQKS